MNRDETATYSYQLTLAYDGREYFGWQRHGNKPTIQFECEKAIDHAFGVHVSVKGSGRTDRGAHAHGQVASVELSEALDELTVKDKLNSSLPEDIRILSVSRAAPGFHARDDAVGKRYRYLIWNDIEVPYSLNGRVWHVKSPLDVEAMEAACSIFVGESDFASFATRTNFKQKSTVRTISFVKISKRDHKITIDICADGFLYKMVRNIVRTIVKVGEGRYSRSDLAGILRKRDRKAAPGTAPASGLYLEKVFYSSAEMEGDKENIMSHEQI